MRIMFVTRKFGNVERNSHCDFTPVRVARLFLDCNGVFAIKAYSDPGEYRCGHTRENKNRAANLRLKDPETHRSEWKKKLISYTADPR